MSGGPRRPQDLAASVRQRLLNLARQTGEDYNALLLRFATERLLFRLSRSSQADRLILKGAWLFYAFYDLVVLANEQEFDGVLLRDQIRETFARRDTALPEGIPAGLGDPFAEDPDAQRQWSAFIGRSRAQEVQQSFPEVVMRVREMVLPVLRAAALDTPFVTRWVPPVGWD